MSELDDYDRIEDDDRTTVSVKVPAWSDQTLARAVSEVAIAYSGVSAERHPEGFAWLQNRAITASLQPHVAEPQDADGYENCGCPCSGYWCPDADGLPQRFYRFSFDDVFELDAWPSAVWHMRPQDDAA